MRKDDGYVLRRALDFEDEDQWEAEEGMKEAG